MINFSKIIDISWPITENMTSYKDKQETVIKHTAQFDANGYRKSTITLSSHAGTHVDAPSHFLEHGKSIEGVPLNNLLGYCKVLDLMHVKEKITVPDLEAHEINAGSIVLCKTKNSMHLPTASFDYHFVYIAQEAAYWLAHKKIRAIGFDYLGIERNQPQHESHNAFLANNIALVEGLRLKDVVAGSYFFCCLPLNVQGFDGAPARAILLQ